MHPDPSLPPGWATNLTHREVAALLRHLHDRHDLAHDDDPDEPDDLRL